MKNWLDTMNRLRAARQAREDFLFREFVDRSIIGPMLLDRVAADLTDKTSYQPQPHMTSVESMVRFADDRYLE